MIHKFTEIRAFICIFNMPLSNTKLLICQYCKMNSNKGYSFITSLYFTVSRISEHSTQQHQLLLLIIITRTTMTTVMTLI